MPIKLAASACKAIKGINDLERRLVESQSVAPQIQYFIAELVMIRLFSIVEENIALTAYKLACGAAYLNGVRPKLLAPRSRSVDHARTQMKTYNRRKPIDLRWGALKDIKDATKHIIDGRDFFIRGIGNYGQLLSDMCKVRNFVAHGNTSSRKKYKEVVRSTYGVELNISVGAFLLSTKRRDISNLSRYLRTSKILIDDISKGG